jgi:hypothetical protein
MSFFGKMNLWSNGIWLNGEIQTVFGQMVFRSNGLSVKRCSAKWRSVNRLFGQKAFDQKKPVK